MGQGYGTVVLFGACDDAERAKAIEAFQENNGKVRVMITQTACGGVGVNLQDKFGDWPRDLYAFADYRALLCHQAANRTQRSDSRSNSTCRFIYLRNAEEDKQENKERDETHHVDESLLLSAMTRKGEIMRDVAETKQKTEKPILYPCDYSSVTLNGLVVTPEVPMQNKADEKLTRRCRLDFQVTSQTDVCEVSYQADVV
jgi:hypothetical protein